MPKHSRITLREIRTPDEWRAMHHLVKQQNKDLSKKQFEPLLKEMRARGYRCIGAFAAGELLGIMGFWIGFRFWCRKYIDIDNVIVDANHRSRGIGSKMLKHVEKIAREENCYMAVLDSYTTAQNAHRFYFREGYAILGYHFTKYL